MELYVHLPFCVRKCNYCDFASWSGLENRMEAYVTRVLHEAESRADEAEGCTVSSVFIGGGTPSILPVPLFRRLVNGIRSVFTIPSGIEWTVEANPGTLTPEWLEYASLAGINRISLGMQAGQDRLLKLLGRIHSVQEAEEAVESVRQAGINNINLDLMFGLPTQTAEDWKETLNLALGMEVTHLSCYGLIPEDGTKLKQALDRGQLCLPPEDTERAMYDTAREMLHGNGFMQYEISNFARKGCECRHNIGYWRQVPYIGLGCAAASMTGMKREENGISYLRKTNPADFESYMKGNVPVPERIGPREARFETMMLGLRMTEGVSEAEFEQMHGLSLTECYGEKLLEQQKAGLMAYQSGRWYLTRSGMDLQNRVLVDLMD